MSSQERIADVVLLYLGVRRKTAPTTAACEKALAKLCDPDRVRGALETLESQALVRRVGRSAWELSTAGAERGSKVFALSLPTGRKWGSLRRQIALASIGATPPAGSRNLTPVELFEKALAGSGGVESLSSKTATRALDELIWKELGGREGTKPSWGSVRRLVLNRLLGSERDVSTDAAVRGVLAKRLGISRPDSAELEAGLIRNWLRPSPEESVAASTDEAPPPGNGSPRAEPASPRPRQELTRDDVEAVDDSWLDSCLPDILGSARADQTLGHGDRKRFLSSVYDTYRQRRGADALSWPDFVRLMLLAHLREKVTLTRADLVSAMDPRAVSSSEVLYEGARFHFLVLEDSRHE